MRLAWFRPPSADPPAPSDDTALLIRAMGPRSDVDLIDAARAHDFVWQHARQPYDLCVFELGGTPAHQFVAAYAVHYPGIVLLRGLPRHDIALLASRLVVVPHEPVAQTLADDYPGARVRTLTPGVEPLLRTPGTVVDALRWPPDGAALTNAIAGFAAGCAVIVFDGPETADWPSLDPQNWQPRERFDGGRDARSAPICVSIDPRDEAHSLRLTHRRLEADASLRAALGAAAQAWWREHATVTRAMDGFQRLIEEARDLPDPEIGSVDEGLELAGRVLGEFGVDVRSLWAAGPPR